MVCALHPGGDRVPHQNNNNTHLPLRLHVGPDRGQVERVPPRRSKRGPADVELCCVVSLSLLWRMWMCVFCSRLGWSAQRRSKEGRPRLYLSLSPPRWHRRGTPGPRRCAPPAETAWRLGGPRLPPLQKHRRRSASPPPPPPPLLLPLLPRMSTLLGLLSRCRVAAAPATAQTLSPTSRACDLLLRMRRTQRSTASADAALVDAGAVGAVAATSSPSAPPPPPRSFRLEVSPQHQRLLQDLV